ncbi:MAG: hypothetical protein B0D92_02625 [Spirochaeta sp. LUC14_002_19_P3]|nr:MAG: hypothetical protein B0D92_02625 [Spirochaeta sp. LUC14_002_19_P3]
MLSLLKPAALRLGITIFTGLLFGTAFLSAIDTAPLWRQALGGKINAYPAQGPGGAVYIIADNRAVHSINPLTGETQWRYRPGGKLLNTLLAAPDGTIYVQNDRQELFAITPGGTGRWKMLMQADAAALPAASPDGRLLVPLNSRRIVCVSRFGEILWSRDESAEASSAPAVDSDGNFWLPLTDGRILILNPWGNTAGEHSDSEPAAVLALDSQGKIWAGGIHGGVKALKFSADTLTEVFRTPIAGSRTAAILTNSSGGGLVFYQDGSVFEVSPTGKLRSLSKQAMSGGHPSQALDSTIFSPAADGSIQVTQLSGESTVLRTESVLAEPLLTEEGILIAGGDDWILYGWNIGVPPGEGWSQFRGTVQRSGSLFSERTLYSRAEARKHPGFLVREIMAQSSDISQQLALIAELESYKNELKMYRELPWANLLLQDMAANGTIRHPSLASGGIVREKTYTLIGRSLDFRMKDFLLECLKLENDPGALASGFLALGTLGTDTNGASIRLIAGKYRQFPLKNERLTLAAAAALAAIQRYNGTITDPAGYQLMEYLLSYGSSQKIRNEIRKLFQMKEL